ncbi:MAG: GNAT family N-acetyltransferase [Myxococcota bacterium]
MTHSKVTSENSVDQGSAATTRSRDGGTERTPADAASVRLALALRPDAEALRDAAVESFLDDWATYGAMPPRIEEVAFHSERIADRNYYTILCGGELAGAILVEPQSNDAAEVALFFVTPAFQNRRIGGRALELVEACYPQVATWRLLTPSSDPRNRRFYERHGYRGVGTLAPEGRPGPTVIRYEKRTP